MYLIQGRTRGQEPMTEISYMIIFFAPCKKSANGANKYFQYTKYFTILKKKATQQKSRKKIFERSKKFSLQLENIYCYVNLPEISGF